MFLSPEEYKARTQAELDAGERIGHRLKGIFGATMDDTARCACGWESVSYWDGADLAHRAWRDHIVEQGAVIAYPDGTVLQRKHLIIREAFNCSPEDLAAKIGDLRYDELSALLAELVKKVTQDSDADLARGRKRLSHELAHLARLLCAARMSVDKVWSICAPFMN
jgi:hypothetical protein